MKVRLIREAEYGSEALTLQEVANNYGAVITELASNADTQDNLSESARALIRYVNALCETNT